MKKLLFLVAFAAITVTTANAQWNIRYQGEVQAGYSFGVGTWGTDRVNIHTVHGIRFNEYLFAGLGTGLDIYTEGGGDLALPIFLNVKGYLPVASKLNIFAGIDFGGSFVLSESLSGLLVVPHLGIAYKLNDRNALTFSFGYTSQAWSESGISVHMNAITLKLGFQF